MTPPRPPLSPATEVRWLKEVGPARAAHLERLGLRTCGDLLRHLPARYEDLSQRPALNAVQVGDTVTVTGRVTRAEKGPRGTRLRFSCRIEDETGALLAVWFGHTGAAKVCIEGETVVLAGTVRSYNGRLQLVNPTAETPAQAAKAVAETGGIRPVYPATEGVPAPVVRRLVTQSLKVVEALPDALPAELRERHDWPPLAPTLQTLHRPASLADAARARERLAYEELLLMQLVLAMRRRQVQVASKAVPLTLDADLEARIRRRLRHTLTPGQESVITEIRADLVGERPMHRLLQGDVGSGKTLVAVYAMLVAVGNDAQAALLAPTEVLAEQHHATLRALLRGAKVQPVLLHGGQPAHERRAIEAALASGECRLVVATHALLSAGIAFPRLSVLVIDEQQRFGVRQKAAAIAKGARPDVLVTTATPIPRTLALTLFGDLDVSVLEGFPPGRLPVKTRWVRRKQRERAWRAIQQTVKRGERVFVVAPRISDDGDEEKRSAERLADELRAHLPPTVGVGLLHGRLPRDERQQVMEAFRDGRTPVVAATTVIEVGVDVPEATLMVVEDADRFGLAQLHQLRGRVGRGAQAGTCLLVADPTTPEGRARLEALVASSDGFRIAEADLKLRGPGELFGLRQSGLPDLRIARLPEDVELLADARDDALALVAADPSLARSEHALLRDRLLARFPEGGRLIGIA